jgi:hypothetical protein
MASKNYSSLKFLERTNRLASKMGISLRSLAPKMGISVASLFGYRNGSIPISQKAWKKLEQAERDAGPSTEEVLLDLEVRRDERLTDHPGGASVHETGDPAQRIARQYFEMEFLMKRLRIQMNELFEQSGLSIPMADFISLMKAKGAWPLKEEDEALTYGELIRKYYGESKDSGDL